MEESKKAKLREAMGWFDAILKGREFAATDHFTIADLTLAVTVSQMEAFGFEMNAFSRIKTWLQRCKDEMHDHDYEVKKIILNPNGQNSYRIINFYRKSMAVKRSCWLICLKPKSIKVELIMYHPVTYG